MGEANKMRGYMTAVTNLLTKNKLISVPTSDEDSSEGE